MASRLSLTILPPPLLPFTMRSPLETSAAQAVASTSGVSKDSCWGCGLLIPRPPPSSLPRSHGQRAACRPQAPPSSLSLVRSPLWRQSLGGLFSSPCGWQRPRSPCPLSRVSCPCSFFGGPCPWAPSFLGLGSSPSSPPLQRAQEWTAHSRMASQKRSLVQRLRSGRKK